MSLFKSVRKSISRVTKSVSKRAKDTRKSISRVGEKYAVNPKERGKLLIQNAKQLKTAKNVHEAASIVRRGHQLQHHPVQATTTNIIKGLRRVKSRDESQVIKGIRNLTKADRETAAQGTFALNFIPGLGQGVSAVGMSAISEGRQLYVADKRDKRNRKLEKTANHREQQIDKEINSLMSKMSLMQTNTKIENSTAKILLDPEEMGILTPFFSFFNRLFTGITDKPEV